MLIEAILRINPNAKVSVFDEDINQITWLEGTPEIPKADIQTKMNELQAEYDSQAYARNRKAEYDQLNQFEMIFDDDRDGTTTWVDTINEIKGRHPK
jgi:hypothetical protein